MSEKQKRKVKNSDEYPISLSRLRLFVVVTLIGIVMCSSGMFFYLTTISLSSAEQTATSVVSTNQVPYLDLQPLLTETQGRVILDMTMTAEATGE